MGDHVWNTAIWRKTWGDQRGLVLAFAALWGVFPWLFLWLSAQIPMLAFQDVLLQAIPKDWQRLSGVPFSEVATHAGRVALAFVDPVVVLAATVWGITRGSDAVSGQLERGTMELLLAQPVQRKAVWVTQALATTAAAACLCGVLALSVCAAVAYGPWAGKVEPDRFLLPVANVFGLMVCLAGISACVSAADSYRWRTIGVMSGFYVFSLLAKLVGRMSGAFGWVGYLSFLNAYEPQRLVGDPAVGWTNLFVYDASFPLLLRPTESAAANLVVYDGILLGVGCVAYVIGGVIFCRRDLPAPL